MKDQLLADALAQSLKSCNESVSYLLIPPLTGDKKTDMLIESAINNLQQAKTSITKAQGDTQ